MSGDTVRLKFARRDGDFFVDAIPCEAGLCVFEVEGFWKLGHMRSGSILHNLTSKKEALEAAEFAASLWDNYDTYPPFEIVFSLYKKYPKPNAFADNGWKQVRNETGGQIIGEPSE